MKKVVVIFPDNKSLADFISNHQISHAEADSTEKSLIAALEHDEIIIAVDEYKAHLNEA